MFRIAICDKTPALADDAVKLIRSCLAGGGAGIQIECFATLSELKRAVLRESGKYRLLVLETEVRDEDGIETARLLREKGCLADIVFRTDDDTRALEAFSVYPIGYILKTCAESELCRAVAFIADRNAKKPSIILKGDDGRKNGFRVDDIIYIEVFRTELEVHSTEGKTNCVGSLREVSEKLPSGRFYRSHRSFIVNLARVKRVEKYQFVMDNGDVVSVAKNRYAEAKKAWRDFCN